MSASSYSELDVAEQVARIRRMQEESDKFSAENHKLIEESLKMAAKAAKLRRDHDLAPWQLLLTGAAAGASFLVAAVGVLKWIGL